MCPYIRMCASADVRTFFKLLFLLWNSDLLSGKNECNNFLPKEGCVHRAAAFGSAGRNAVFTRKWHLLEYFEVIVPSK